MSKLRSILVLVLLTISSVVMKASIAKLIDEEMNGLIAAFGDFDSDKLTDVFVITQNAKSLELLKGYPNEPVLRKSSIKCWFNNSAIVGVIPSDFSGQAMMDVLVVTNPSPEVIDKPLFDIWLLRGSIKSLECVNQSKALVAGVKSHPLVLDYNGDMIADFIVETNDCKRELWMRTDSTSFQKECPPELQPKDNQSMRFPNSNAFINLDEFKENMSPDIYISGESVMEYWYDDKGFSVNNMVMNKYPKSEEYPHRGQSAFVDINSDGLIDHIMPVCKSEAKTCKEPQILGYSKEYKNWTVISDLNSDNDSNLTFAEMITFGQKLPITVRNGDIDGDGYPDLITIMRNKENRFKAVILKNKKANNLFGRQFVIDWTSDKHLSSGLDVEIAAFIDLFEDGKLDILMTTKDTKDSKRSVEAVVNTQMIAACFLKVLVTSGLCYGSSCPRGNIPYGTNQFGPFVCYQLQDLDGNWQTACAGQLSQSAHSSLQMPYSVFGLGETPNFVENLYAAIPSGGMASRWSKWTQIVPDAQVVLIPFPPNDTSAWISKLFYTPSNIVFSTLITLAAICCILVLIIGILHRKELLEDLAEHEEYKRHWPESR